MDNVSSFKHINKNVPKLRFPGFEGEWEETFLSELLEFQNGINAESEKYGKGIKYISVMDILNNDYITYSNIRGLVDIDDSTLQRYSVKYGDILFQRSSETKEDIGNTNVYLDRERTATFGGFVIRGKKIGDYDPFFLKCLLCCPSSRKKLVRMGAGSQHYNIGQENLSKIQIRLPDLSEQQKISHLMMLLNKRIAKQRELINIIKTYKRGVIQSVFGGNSLNKFSSNNWGRITIKDLFQSINDRNHSDECVLTIIQGKGTIPRDSVERRITYNKSSVSSYKKVKKNDFILHLRSFEGGLEIANEDGIVSPAYTILRANNSINPIFFYSYFRSYDFINNKLRVAVEGIRDGKSINMDTFWNIEIPYPCMTEQNYIADLLSKLDEYTNNQTLQFKKLISLKSALLQQMFI